MKLNLLVSVAAMVCLTWPATVLADPPSDQGQAKGQAQDQGKAKGHGQGQGQIKGQGQGQAQGQTRSQGQAQGQTKGQGQGQVQGQGQGQGRGQGQVQTGQQGYRGTPSGAAAQTQSVNKPATTYRPPAVVATRPPASAPAVTGWRRGMTGPVQVQAGQQWRQQNSGWNSGAVWRQNSNWWRGNSAFSLWSGARVGFFFIPAFGYVAVPAEYRTHRWRAGDDLPNWFWRYAISDYWDYGLPQPPDGCAWVWVNNDVALIDLDDGYILDIEQNVW